MSSAFTSPPTDEARSKPLPLIVFFGTVLCFPEYVISNFRVGFPGFSFLRVSNADLLDGLMRSGRVKMAVFGQELMNEALGAAVRRDISIAIAYKDLLLLAETITEICEDDLPDGVGYLPMAAGNEARQAILSLLLCGECNIPVPLYRAIRHCRMTDLARAGSTPAAPPSDASQRVPEFCRETLPRMLIRREMDVLPLVADGKQNKVIAEELSVSEHTVKLHLHHIMTKLKVHSRTAAARWYHEHAQDAQGL